jgi:hypothetical protein
VSVLPWRARGDWVIADTHRTDAPSVRGAERVVPVAEQMLGCFIPRERLRDLPCDPLRRRIAGYCDPEEPSSSVAKNYQTIEQLERDGVDHEQINRSYSRSMITQERFPALRPAVGQS